MTKRKTQVEICPMCRRLKIRHTKQQMSACTRKKLEFARNKKGGAGIK